MRVKTNAKARLLSRSFVFYVKFTCCIILALQAEFPMRSVLVIFIVTVNFESAYMNGAWVSWKQKQPEGV